MADVSRFGGGRGSASAAPYAAAARTLFDSMHLPDWVAEEAHLHLQPGLEAALANGDLPLRLVDAQTAPDGTVVLDLNWAGDAFSRRSQREAVFALIGAIAEAATYVRERRVATDLGQQTGEFEVVTGQLPGEGPFQTHGHTLRFRISR